MEVVRFVAEGELRWQMPARRKRKKQIGRTRMSLSRMDVNGQQCTGFDYLRVDYDDGTCKETGLPAGCRPRPSLADLVAATILKRGKGK